MSSLKVIETGDRNNHALRLHYIARWRSCFSVSARPPDGVLLPHSPLHRQMAFSVAYSPL